MIKKILKYGALGLVCLVAAVVSSALLYRDYLQHEVRKERAIHTPNGIESLEAVRIGGIEQWIEVRGEDVNNPILLFIHGGPGIAFIPMAAAWQGPWEKYFTVVQWDQRGAGKTYASNDRELQRRTMNLEQMERDAVEVVNYLRQRFRREKIFVVGHSWGSVLGLWLAHEHPEAVYAFVGTGQAINMEQNEAMGYRDALEAARKQHNEEAVKQLESVAPYPPAEPDFNKTSVVRNWERDLLGPPAGSGPVFLDGRRIVTGLVSAPEYSVWDDAEWVRAQMFSLQTMHREAFKINLEPLGREFRAPIFFFEGRYDPYCRPALIAEYVETMQAPKKEIVWFEKSGHFPFFEEKQKFADELVEQVLPLAR